MKAELLYGARKSKRVNENLKPLEALFGLYASMAFDDEAAHWYGRVRAQLDREGQIIGGDELMIAAIALASDATVVTRNEREFRRVPGLAWSAGERLRRVLAHHAGGARPEG